MFSGCFNSCWSSEHDVDTNEYTYFKSDRKISATDKKQLSREEIARRSATAKRAEIASGQNRYAADYGFQHGPPSSGFESTNSPRMGGLNSPMAAQPVTRGAAIASPAFVHQETLPDGQFQRFDWIKMKTVDGGMSPSSNTGYVGQINAGFLASIDTLPSNFGQDSKPLFHTPNIKPMQQGNVLGDPNSPVSTGMHLGNALPQGGSYGTETSAFGFGSPTSGQGWSSAHPPRTQFSPAVTQDPNAARR